jgi:hypothetical protein
MIIREGLNKLQKYRRRGAGKTKKFIVSSELIGLIMSSKHSNVQYALIQMYLGQLQDRNIKNSLNDQVSLIANES